MSDILSSMRRAEVLGTAAAVILLAGFGADSVAGVQEPGAGESEQRWFYGAEIVLNASPHDIGYFNEATYATNTLRLFRLNGQMEFLLSRGLSVHFDIRSDNLESPIASGLYARFRPWEERAFALQIGRVPPVIGGFPRRRYNSDNPLIGYPLAYQYPTLVRSDAAVGTAAELARFRGFGAKLDYPLGEQELESGLPMMDAFRWDTGIAVLLGEAGRDRLSLQMALTNGSAGAPLVGDNNSGKQFSGRLGFRPAFFLSLGGSFSTGEYVSDELYEVVSGLPEFRDADELKGGQRLGALDAELAHGPWLIRSEFLVSSWDVPTVADSLAARGVYAEVRRTLSPMLYVAARLGRMSFGEITMGGETMTWDSAVTRFEAGVGYRIQRNWQVKASYQFNTRDAGILSERHLPNFQVYFWW